MDESLDRVRDPLAGEVVADEEGHAVLILELGIAAQAASARRRRRMESLVSTPFGITTVEARPCRKTERSASPPAAVE